MPHLTGGSAKQKVKATPVLSLPESNVQLQRMTTPEINQALKNVQRTEAATRTTEKNLPGKNPVQEKNAVQSVNTWTGGKPGKIPTKQAPNSKDQSKITIMSPKPARENVKNIAETMLNKERKKLDDSKLQANSKPSNSKTTSLKPARKTGDH